MADYPSPPPVPNSTPAKTSGMAVTSLVLGILGVFTCGATALFGLIFGIIALVKVKNSGGRLKGDGIALAGLIVSAVFLILIPVFVAMFLPALAAGKARGQTINCVNNEKQLAMAIKIYANQHANHLPPAATWCDAIESLVASTNVFKCPAALANSRCDYAFNAALDGLDASKADPRTVMLFESDGGWNASGGRELMVSPARHQGGRIYVVTFADGSVMEVPASQLDTLRWSP